MYPNSTLCRCALGPRRPRFHAAMYPIFHVESVTASKVAMCGRVFRPLGFSFLFEHFTVENQCKSGANEQTTARQIRVKQ